MEEFTQMEEESNGTLRLLQEQLEEELRQEYSGSLKLKISTTSTVGEVAPVLADLENAGTISLVVAGIHHKDSLREQFFGTKMRALIDITRYPLLLVPLESGIPHLKRLVLAIDMKFPDQDLAVLRIPEKPNAH